MEDVTLEVLRGIRSDLAGVREEIGGLRSDLRATNERVDGTNERLEALARRQTEGEVRLATEIVAVAGAVHQLRDALLEDRVMRTQVADHEARIRELEARRGRPA